MDVEERRQRVRKRSISIIRTSIVRGFTVDSEF
jgi:hypothetical protein